MGWAKNSPCVRRLDVLVYAHNHGAIRRCRRLGFEMEGRRRRAILRVGECIEELEMALTWQAARGCAPHGRRRGHALDDDARDCGVVVLLMIFAVVVGGVILVIVLAVRRGSRPEFPVLPAAPMGDGPGQFRIVGVKREDSTDVECTMEAGSPANAKVKAELQGIIVTGVTRIG